MRRLLSLALVSASVFCAVVAVLWRLMPQPRKQVDYLVMGAAATMAAMAVLFVILSGALSKGSGVFFRRRKPDGS